MDKETKKLVSAAEKAGFDVRYTSDGHPMIFTADGEYVTKMATSASDVCSIRNTLARIKRIGGHIYRKGQLVPIGA